MSLADEHRSEIPSKEILLEEVIPHKVTFKTFHHLFRFADLRTKWGSFSQETQENIFMFFEHKRGLVEIHDPKHFADWNYWQGFLIDFIINFDESNPKYGENFEAILGMNK